MSTNRPDAALQRAFAVLVALALAALAAVGVWAHAQYAPLDEATQRFERTRGTVPAVDAVVRAAIAADAAARGRLLGSAHAAQRYHEATAGARGRLAEIAAQVQGDAAQEAELARLRAALETQFALLDRAVALDPAQADDARAVVLGEDARRLLAEVRQVGDAMVAREGRRFDERVAIGRRVRHATEAFAAAAVAVLAFVLAGATFLTRRELRLRAALADDLREGRNRLELSERRLKAITDNLPALIGYVDRHEAYRFLNAAYRPIFGVDPDATVGRTMTEVLGPATYARVEEHVRAALAGQTRTFEHHGIGRAADIVLETSYLPDVNPTGGVDGFYVMAVDVTARKAAELELARGERRLRMVTDSVPALIGHVDANQVYRFVNATYEAVFGIPQSEFIGRTLAQMLGAAAYAKVAAPVAAALRGEPQRF
ncbi:MAG: PAS domain-containing protein [Burkholderiaceae bacterium]